MNFPVAYKTSSKEEMLWLFHLLVENFQCFIHHDRITPEEFIKQYSWETYPIALVYKEGLISGCGDGWLRQPHMKNSFCSSLGSLITAIDGVIPRVGQKGKQTITGEALIRKTFLSPIKLNIKYLDRGVVNEVTTSAPFESSTSNGKTIGKVFVREDKKIKVKEINASSVISLTINK